MTGNWVDRHSAALAMMGVKSILDAWKISGVFAGGMLGLFLLGFISRRATTPGPSKAMTALILDGIHASMARTGWFRPFHST